MPWMSIDLRKGLVPVKPVTPRPGPGKRTLAGVQGRQLSLDSRPDRHRVFTRCPAWPAREVPSLY